MPLCVRSPLPSWQLPFSPSPSRTTAILGAIDAYESSCARWYAARCAQPLRMRTRARGLRSIASRSRARPASGRRVSGPYESPCFPYSHCSRCRSQGAGSPQPRSPSAARARRADDAERARRAVLVRECGCVGVFVCGRVRLRVRVRRGAWRWCRAHSLRASHAAHGSMREVARSGRAGDRDRAARAVT